MVHKTPEARRAYQAARHLANREAILARHKAHYDAGGGERQTARGATPMGRAKTAARNARRMFGEDVHWSVYLRLFYLPCSYQTLSPRCSGPDVPAMQVDHYLPRSKGGRNVLLNLRSSCWPCNRAKHADIPPDELSPLEARYADGDR
jgi:5-methylcytosine-specific restriction endonuclease McrA